MKAKQSMNEVRVILFDKEIGRLHWNDKTCRSYFFFSPEYFQMNIDIAPIVAPKGSIESKYAIYGNSDQKIYQKLPPFISDSLPDDWGNTLFDQWFKDNGFHEKEKTPIAKLSFIGKRAMGALEFLPCYEDYFDEKENISLGSLYSLALKIEEDREMAVILPEESMTKKALLAVGTSAGGRFKKAIIAKAPDGSIHSGQTSVNPGWNYYIVKFNDTATCRSEIEQTYYEMATEAGIEMSSSELITIEGIKHFCTERFDRMNGKKIMTMTLAAMNPDAESYEDLFRTCNRLEIPENEKTQLFIRMAFNIMSSNTDDHSKNFSFVMDDSGNWHISKAYDINFIFRTLNTPETEHCFTLRGKSNSFSEKDLIMFAKEYNIKSAKAILAKIRASIETFESKALGNGVRGDILEIIQRRLNQIKHEMEGIENEVVKWPDYEINGHSVMSFHFDKNERGSICVSAVIDGRPSRKVISHKHPDYLIITERFNSSPDSLKRRLAKEYFLK